MNAPYSNSNWFTLFRLGETSIKKNRLNLDIVQKGWVGQGLKPHFFQNRNMDKGKVWVGQNLVYPMYQKVSIVSKQA